MHGSSCCPSLDLEWQAAVPRLTLSPTWIRTAGPSTDPMSASRCSLSLFTYACIYLFPAHLRKDLQRLQKFNKRIRKERETQAAGVLRLGFKS